MNTRLTVLSNHTRDWRKFAALMFKLEDADPGYMLLKRAEVPYRQKLRYVLAWCTYYNPGLAALISRYEGQKFWDALLAEYPHAKRASERRHFRGRAGLVALADWQIAYNHPEDMVEACYADTYLGVRKNMRDMTQMGDYFYWKLADIWDTVFDKPVDFTGCEKYMPKVPKQGAELIWDADPTFQDEGAFDLEYCMADVTDYVSRIKYPVKGGRKLALQEAETVCCVFKQHVVGDYHFGERSYKAWMRLNAVREQSPKTVDKYLNGLYAGGIWTPAKLAEVSEMLG